MYYWYDARTQIFPLPKLLLTITTVFSAPRYCDSTENKGAFINIESDYKLKYTQFDAVPHPPIKAMV